MGKTNIFDFWYILGHPRVIYILHIWRIHDLNGPIIILAFQQTIYFSVKEFTLYCRNISLKYIFLETKVDIAWQIGTMLQVILHTII